MLAQPHRLVALGLVAGLLTACGDQPQTFARAHVMEGLDETIGGPKGLGRPGDILLENDAFKVVVLGARHSMGPGLFGGSLVDADRQWRDPAVGKGRGRDQFNEMFPTVNLNVPAARDPNDPSAFDVDDPQDQAFVDDPGEVTIVSDGSDGGPAIVAVEGLGVPFLSILDVLWGIVGQPDMDTRTEYIAEPGVPWLTIRTTVSFGEPVGEPEEMDYRTGGLPVLSLAMESGVVAGDFFLCGGSLDVFAPGIGFDEDGAVFRAQRDGKNTMVDPFEFEFLGGTGDGISYGIAPKDGNLYVPLFTASQTVAVGAGLDGVIGEDGEVIPGRFPQGSSYTYERYFFVGDGDVGSLVDQYLAARDIPSGTLTGRVIEEGTGTALSGIDVFVFRPGEQYPWSQWRTDVSPEDGLADGSFGGTLPVGEWELMVHDRGRPDGERIPIEVKEGGELTALLEAPRGGLLRFDVVDETGLRVPSKVSIYRTDTQTNRSPALGDGFIADDPETVVFAPYGVGETSLPAGTYRAVASRGIEYELDVSEEFTVDARRSQDMVLQVIRSVDTTGWVSADLHVHAEPSHDSGVALHERAIDMVCEGVEFFTSNDHDVLTDYAPILEDLGLTDWAATAVGTETTTVELGHFLGFPLERHYLADAGGAMDWTGMPPDEILDQLTAQGNEAGYEPIRFVAHPRDGILGYFDQYGFDPYAGTPGNPAVATPLFSTPNHLLDRGSISWDFEALELLTGKRIDLHRTPTQAEIDAFAEGEGDVYDWISRTMEEQQALIDGTYRLGAGIEGNLDDWFTLLNLGFTFTVLGDSDTHGLHSVEGGCPRNFVIADTDDPGFLDPQAMADAIRDHRVVASYGPFVELWVDGEPVGSTVTAGGPVDLQVRVQAPSWVAVDRVEIYENGTLIEEIAVPDTGGALRLDETLTLTLEPTEDAWYVAIVIGDGSMSPACTPVEIPYIDLQLVVLDALSAVPQIATFLDPAIPFPREYPVHPFAVTNPIWVDRDGDGFDAPGLPDWLERPE